MIGSAGSRMSSRSFDSHAWLTCGCGYACFSIVVLMTVPRLARRNLDPVAADKELPSVARPALHLPLRSRHIVADQPPQPGFDRLQIGIARLPSGQRSIEDRKSVV